MELGLRVKLTATTGVAAENIGGRTIHAALGAGISSDLRELCARFVKSGAMQQWEDVDVLIIDEVSMLTQTMFAHLDQLLTRAKGRSRRGVYFGGIQLILVGDFSQLPPVQPGWVFDTPLWENAIQYHAELSVNHRQDTDSEFLCALNRLRVGIVTPEDENMFASRVVANPTSADAVHHLHIYGRNARVDLINSAFLHKLDASTSRTHKAAVRGRPRAKPKTKYDIPNARAAYVKTLPMMESLELRVGAHVMMTVNDPVRELCNGSQGVVESITESGDPYVLFHRHDHPILIERHEWKAELVYEDITVCQYPLKLAWAITIHKSQGLTLDCARMTIDASLFAYGQAYVVMSRVRTLGGIILETFDVRGVRADPAVLAFYKKRGLFLFNY